MQVSRHNFSEIVVTGDDLISCGWRDAVGEANDIVAYESLLFQAASEAGKEGDSKREMALGLLGAAASMHLDPKNSDAPFSASFVVYGSHRSPDLSDFEDQHLTPLAEALGVIDDNELRARIGDMLWLKGKDYTSGQLAARAYLEAAKFHESIKTWPNGFLRLKRSAQLAFAMGRNSALAKEVVAYCFDVLHRASSEEPSLITLEVSQLLLDLHADEPNRLCPYLEMTAAAFEVKGNFFGAFAVFEGLARAYHRAGNEELARLAMIRKGEAQVKQGEAMASSGNPVLAAEHWIEQGIQTLRRVGGTKERCEELMARLLSLQAAGVGRGTVIEESMPIDAELLGVIESVRGQSLDAALGCIAVMGQPQRKEDVRNQTLAILRECPLTGIFTGIMLRQGGRTDAEIPPVPREAGPERDAVIEQHMWKNLAFGRQMTGGMIERMRQIVASEHPEESRDLSWLFVDNMLVPPGREVIYRQGILAGLQGNYLVSTHLLIPQLESSFRHALRTTAAGAPSLKSDGIQDEQMINPILESPEFVAMFGEDLAFDLRGLLAERAGSNLRHSTAHGLLPYGAFQSWLGASLWAVALYLLFLGKADAEQREGVEGSPTIAND